MLHCASIHGKPENEENQSLLKMVNILFKTIFSIFHYESLQFRFIEPQFRQLGKNNIQKRCKTRLSKTPI